jgi:hypothetical protein
MREKEDYIFKKLLSSDDVVFAGSPNRRIAEYKSVITMLRKHETILSITSDKAQQTPKPKG